MKRYEGRFVPATGNGQSHTNRSSGDGQRGFLCTSARSLCDTRDEKFEPRLVLERNSLAFTNVRADGSTLTRRCCCVVLNYCALRTCVFLFSILSNRVIAKRRYKTCNGEGDLSKIFTTLHSNFPNLSLLLSRSVIILARESATFHLRVLKIKERSEILFYLAGRRQDS